MARSPLTGFIDQIGRLQVVWSLIGGGVMSVLGYIWDFPLPWIIFISLGTVAFLLIIVQRVRLLRLQRVTIPQELYAAVAADLAEVLDIALSTPKGAQPEGVKEDHGKRWNEAFRNARRDLVKIGNDGETYRIATAFLMQCGAHLQDESEHRTDWKRHQMLRGAATYMFPQLQAGKPLKWMNLPQEEREQIRDG